MLAIAGVISTGLVIGSGQCFVQGGPAISIAHVVTGSIIYFIVTALEEMAATRDATRSVEA